MVFIIVVSIGTGFYIIQLNDLLQSVYQPNNSSDAKNTNIPPINQSIIDTFNTLHNSQDATTPEMPSSGRSNPFN